MVIWKWSKENFQIFLLEMLIYTKYFENNLAMSSGVQTLASQHSNPRCRPLLEEVSQTVTQHTCMGMFMVAGLGMTKI